MNDRSSDTFAVTNALFLSISTNVTFPFYTDTLEANGIALSVFTLSVDHWSIHLIVGSYFSQHPDWGFCFQNTLWLRLQSHVLF